MYQKIVSYILIIIILLTLKYCHEGVNVVGSNCTTHQREIANTHKKSFVETPIVLVTCENNNNKLNATIRKFQNRLTDNKTWQTIIWKTEMLSTDNNLTYRRSHHTNAILQETWLLGMRMQQYKFGHDQLLTRQASCHQIQQSNLHKNQWQMVKQQFYLKNRKVTWYDAMTQLHL